MPCVCDCPPRSSPAYPEGGERAAGTPRPELQLNIKPKLPGGLRLASRDQWNLVGPTQRNAASARHTHSGMPLARDMSGMPLARDIHSGMPLALGGERGVKQSARANPEGGERAAGAPSQECN